MLDRWPDTYAWYSDQGAPAARWRVAAHRSPGVLSREVLLGQFWDPVRAARANSDAAALTHSRATSRCTW